MRSRRRKPERRDHALEERRAEELARRLRLEQSRQRTISRPAMAAHDARDRFVRCLIAFYGENAVCSCNDLEAKDVPRRLGRAAEFWTEWESWSRIGAAEREAATAKKAAASARLSEFF